MKLIIIHLKIGDTTMKKMLYYIGESQKELFDFRLIKRFESNEEAINFCKEKVKEWKREGLNAFLNYDEDLRHNPELEDIAVVLGAQAIDYDYVVVHNYNIFATPCFMGGGSIG